MKITVMNFEGKTYEVEVPEAAVEMDITILSGDEIVYFCNKDNEVIDEFDAGMGTRAVDFFDGSYTISRECFEFWSNLASTGDTTKRMYACGDISR